MSDTNLNNGAANAALSVGAAFGAGETPQDGANQDDLKSRRSKFFANMRKEGANKKDGDASLFNSLNAIVHAVADGTIEYVKPKAGAKAKGTVDSSDVGLASKKYCEGGGIVGRSADTFKSSFTSAAAYAANPAWNAVETIQKALAKAETIAKEAADAGEKKSPVKDGARIILALSSAQRAKDQSGIPLDDVAVEKAVRKAEGASRGFKDKLASLLKDAQEEFKTSQSEAVGNLISAMETAIAALEFSADKEAKRKVLDEMIATGLLVRNKRGELVETKPAK